MGGDRRWRHRARRHFACDRRRRAPALGAVPEVVRCRGIRSHDSASGARADVADRSAPALRLARQTSHRAHHRAPSEDGVVVRRALLAGVVGALAAALSLVAAYFMHPGLEYEMDRPLPSFIAGMHGSEHDAQGSFAWTSGHVIVDIPGLDRQVTWSCTLRFRGTRPDNQPRPKVTVAVDGQASEPVSAEPEYQELGIVLPVLTSA